MDQAGVHQGATQAYERLLRAMVPHPPEPVPWADTRLITTPGKVLLSVWSRTATYARALARQLGIGFGGASDIIDVLVGRGLVARRHGEGLEGDRRFVIVDVTPAGDEAGWRLAFPYHPVMIERIRALSERDARDLERVFSRMAEDLEVLKAEEEADLGLSS